MNNLRITDERSAFAWLWANDFEGLRIEGAAGTLVVVEEKCCWRCGGSGYWARGHWNRGGVCFKCGGSGDKRTDRTPLKKWAAAAKRRATAAKRRTEKAAKKAADREANREAGERRWNVANGHGDVTFAERDAKRDAERAAKDARSEWVGTPKTREEFDVTIVAVPTWESRYGYNTTTTYCYLLDDSDGNRLVWKTGTPPSVFLSDDSNVETCKGTAVRIKATVKEHGTRKGAKNTTITRAVKVA